MDRWEYQVISMNAQTDWQTGIGLRKPDLPDADLQGQLNRLGVGLGVHLRYPRYVEGRRQQLHRHDLPRHL
jgi:hypothetical protein